MQWLGSRTHEQVLSQLLVIVVDRRMSSSIDDLLLRGTHGCSNIAASSLNSTLCVRAFSPSSSIAQLKHFKNARCIAVRCHVQAREEGDDG